MKIKIGINGMGRIGRMVIRSIIENENKNIKIQQIYSIVDKLDGTLEELLSKRFLNSDIRYNLFLEAYFQLAVGLKIFQDKIGR